MAHTAKDESRRTEWFPGIWFMPFAGNFRNPYFDPEIFAKNPDGTPFHDGRWSGTCIDMTNPKAERFVRDRVRRIYDWGYRYFKIDGMHTGADHLQHLRQHRLREQGLRQEHLARSGHDAYRSLSQGPAHLARGGARHVHPGLQCFAEHAIAWGRPSA